MGGVYCFPGRRLTTHKDPKNRHGKGAKQWREAGVGSEHGWLCTESSEEVSTRDWSFFRDEGELIQSTFSLKGEWVRVCVCVNVSV